MVAMNVYGRVEQFAREWGLVVERSFETETSVISFVSRAAQKFVLKVIKHEGDEWHSGEILSAFSGGGVVRVHQYSPGAMLLERLRPGTNLVGLTLSGRDDEATDVLAAVIQNMPVIRAADSQHLVTTNVSTVEDWGKGFERYLSTGDERISSQLVESAQQVFANLCASQTQTRLLHGDLQHYNVLCDSERGWLAIDPKGVIGELEYEIGAMLRNPSEAPALFLSPTTIEQRIDHVCDKLKLDRDRVIGWCFSQAVLSAIWQIEDGLQVTKSNSAVRLATVVRPMLSARVR